MSPSMAGSTCATSMSASLKTPFTKFKRPCVFVFEDGDLRSSLETCFIHLWPLLQPGCYFFKHEAHHMEMASVFFDDEFWRAELNSGLPGFVWRRRRIGPQSRSGGLSQ